MGEREGGNSKIGSTLTLRALSGTLGNLDFIIIKPVLVGESHNWLCQRFGVSQVSWQ